jgi:hypothetical protein
MLASILTPNSPKSLSDHHRGFPHNQDKYIILEGKYTLSFVLILTLPKLCIKSRTPLKKIFFGGGQVSNLWTHPSPPKKNFRGGGVQKFENFTWMKNSQNIMKKSVRNFYTKNP